MYSKVSSSFHYLCHFWNKTQLAATVFLTFATYLECRTISEYINWCRHDPYFNFYEPNKYNAAMTKHLKGLSCPWVYVCILLLSNFKSNLIGYSRSEEKLKFLTVLMLHVYLFTNFWYIFLSFSHSDPTYMDH